MYTTTIQDNALRKILEYASGQIAEMALLEMVDQAPDILEWVRDNFEPDDVFTTDQLNTWADNNARN